MKNPNLVGPDLFVNLATTFLRAGKQWNSRKGSYRGSALLYIEYQIVDSGLSRQLEVILELS
jgi:hypothetical protein